MVLSSKCIQVLFIHPVETTRSQDHQLLRASLEALFTGVAAFCRPIRVHSRSFIKNLMKLFQQPPFLSTLVG